MRFLFLPCHDVSLCCSVTSRILFNWFRCEVLVLGAYFCWRCLFPIVNLRARHSLALHCSCALCPPATLWQPCWTKLSCNFARPTPMHIFYGAGLARPRCFFLHPVTAMGDGFSVLLSGYLIHWFFLSFAGAILSFACRCQLHAQLFFVAFWVQSCLASLAASFTFIFFSWPLVFYLVLWLPDALVDSLPTFL